MASDPAPKWLSQLVAAHPRLLSKFCYSGSPDPWGSEPGDPWGYAYWLEVRASGERRIVSSGANGIEGTDDDLWVDLEGMR